MPLARGVEARKSPRFVPLFRTSAHRAPARRKSAIADFRRSVRFFGAPADPRQQNRCPARLFGQKAGKKLALKISQNFEPKFWLCEKAFSSHFLRFFARFCRGKSQIFLNFASSVNSLGQNLRFCWILILRPYKAFARAFFRFAKKP